MSELKIELYIQYERLPLWLNYQQISESRYPAILDDVVREKYSIIVSSISLTTLPLNVLSSQTSPAAVRITGLSRARGTNANGFDVVVTVVAKLKAEVSGTLAIQLSAVGADDTYTINYYKEWKPEIRHTAAVDSGTLYTAGLADTVMTIGSACGIGVGDNGWDDMTTSIG
jgi:hypothetical protein